MLLIAILAESSRRQICEVLITLIIIRSLFHICKVTPNKFWYLSNWILVVDLEWFRGWFCKNEWKENAKKRFANENKTMGWFPKFLNWMKRLANNKKKFATFSTLSHGCESKFSVRIFDPLFQKQLFLSFIHSLFFFNLRIQLIHISSHSTVRAIDSFVYTMTSWNMVLL